MRPNESNDDFAILLAAALAEADDVIARAQASADALAHDASEVAASSPELRDEYRAALLLSPEFAKATHQRVLWWSRQAARLAKTVRTRRAKIYFLGALEQVGMISTSAARRALRRLRIR